jgi:hypothetical protein
MLIAAERRFLGLLVKTQEMPEEIKTSRWDSISRNALLELEMISVAPRPGRLEEVFHDTGTQVRVADNDRVILHSVGEHPTYLLGVISL